MLLLLLLLWLLRGEKRTWAGGVGEPPSFDFTRVVQIFVQTRGDRLFVATAAGTAVEVLLLMLLLLLLLLLMILSADAATGGAVASVGGRLAVLAQAPEVFPAQVRGRLGLDGRRRGHHRERDGRVVDGYLVAAVTRIEVAAAAGRRVRFCVLRFGGGGGDLVRQFRRRRVFHAARRLPAAVHAGQRVVSGRTARRVRLLGRGRRLVRMATAATVHCAAAGHRRRARRHGSRFPRQRRAPSQPRGRPLLFRLVFVL